MSRSFWIDIFNLTAAFKFLPCNGWYKCTQWDRHSWLSELYYWQYVAMMNATVKYDQKSKKFYHGAYVNGIQP